MYKTAELCAVKLCAVAMCVLLGLASAALAQPAEGNWDDESGDHLWSTGANWYPDLLDGNLPSKPHLVSPLYPSPATSIMDIDTRPLGLGNVDVKDFTHLTVQDYLKVSNSIYITTSTIFTVVEGGTVEGDLRVVSNPGVGSEIVFSGGECAGGEWQTPDNRQELIYRVEGSTSGPIAPTAFVNDNQSGTFYDSIPLFNFVLDAAGVTPIEPSGSDPVQIGSGSPETPYELTISGISNYEGTLGEPIPLITFTGGTDADRMFPNDGITFEDLPVDWTAEVNQTDSGVTLTLFTPGLQWDGGAGNWADLKWDGAAPTAEQDMIINADTADSLVTVAADFITGGTGPAASVFVGEEYDARLTVAGGATLEVTGETTAGEFGKIAVENGGTLQSGSAVIEIDGRLISGVQGSDAGLLDSTGQLTIDDADAVQVEWMPGADATSMFGGTYTVARYSGAALATTGTTTNGDANIGAAYVKSVDYDVDLGGGVLGIQVELQTQGLGDTDLDGDVDGDDLATFGLAWAPSGTDKTWFDGDFDFDGDIDGDDLAALGLAWAPSGIDFPAGELEVTAVPEPGTIVMLILAAAGLLIYRKRR